MFGDNETYFEIVGNRLKSIREEIGFSQESLALVLEEEFDLKIKQIAISRLEKNLNGSIKNVLKILEYYNSRHNYNINWILVYDNKCISKFNIDVSELGINRELIDKVGDELIVIAKKLKNNTL